MNGEPSANDPLLASLRAAVDARPEDVLLRMHYAEQLELSGYHALAIQQAATVLQNDPSNAAALSLISGTSGLASERPLSPAQEQSLSQLDSELNDIVAPPFVEPDDDDVEDDVPAVDLSSWRVEAAGLRLTDVGGMQDVKARLQASVLAPLQNPELGRLYKRSVGGGLLLYGPPGCGKTFIARALAGEMGAGFLSVSLSDVLSMWIGASEGNIHEIFEIARANKPCVLFFDEIDALGHKRTNMRGSERRGAVNQLLTEMDGINDNNDGVFILAATNHPWDVDVALRRPGRFDRMLLVLPPDEEAREQILRFHLQDRPIAGIDVSKIAKRTEGYSGADLAAICTAAAELALIDSVTSGVVRMIEQRDMDAALHDIRPSIGPWLSTASNVAQFANQDGSYDDLKKYLRQRKII